MDDIKLEKIISADYAPLADENARKRAVNLALAEFNVVQNEKNTKSSQGVSILSRLMGMSNISKGRETMETKTKRKLIYGGMATALAVVFVAGLSMNQLQDTVRRYDTSTVNRLPTGLDAGAPGATEASPAYVAAVEQKNEIALEEALKKGDSAIPVPTETPQTRLELPQQGNERDEDQLQKWKVEQEAKIEAELGRQTNEPALADTAKDQIAIEGVGESKEDPLHRWRQMQQERPEKVAGKDKAINMAAGNAGAVASMPSQIIASPQAPASNVILGFDGDVRTQYYQEQGRDKFEQVKPNAFKQVTAEPVSTFSSDVDTASYSFVRRELNNGILPNPDSVRVEEMVNYFDYNYPLPESRDQPFKPTVTVIDSPWAGGKKLMHIGIKGYDIQGEKPHTNLVFLLDVSGSMNEPSKLPLVKASMKMLIDSLKPDDTIAITVYAGAAGTVLEPTKVSERSKILQAIDTLEAGGSTAGEAGINLAYQLAQQNFDKDGVNRIILATDGDFNVGTSSTDELKALVEKKRESGIFLSVLGFGQGNYNDAIMQTLAQNGNGVAAYIDTLNEARKVLVDEASSSLFPIAKDVKFQVEFNPKTVAEYRLVGYETRALNREDFNNDKIDAGDMGAGHTVTAIYEFVPVGSTALSVDPLRYADKDAEKVVDSAEPTPDNGEYAFLKIRYKLPNEDVSKLITTPVTQSSQQPLAKTDCGSAVDCLQRVGASDDVRFSTSVAAFAQILKNDNAIAHMSLDDVIALAQSGKGEDPFGYRAEFINLVRLAKASRQ